MKTRLDVAMTEKGICESREKARALILEGKVCVNGQKADKCGFQIKEEDEISLLGKPVKYVSRGGLKLEKALMIFPVEVKNKICLDIGASTGGFTDCLLQNGADKVYSVDVGYGQLAYSLRTDERVSVIERCNFRYIERSSIEDLIQVIVCDVSFISLVKIADKIKEFAQKDTDIILLIKPQFESEKNENCHKGVINDKITHKNIVKSVIYNLNLKHLYMRIIDYSPIKGPKGNIEFIVLMTVDENKAAADGDALIDAAVEKAHEELDK